MSLWVFYYSFQVEKRVGDAVFTISDLCSLIRVLSVGARGDVSVTENVWIHLGSRYKEIDAANIADVYRVMRYIIPKAQYLWRVIERQLQVICTLPIPLFIYFYLVILERQRAVNCH